MNVDLPQPESAATPTTSTCSSTPSLAEMAVRRARERKRRPPCGANATAAPTNARPRVHRIVMVGGLAMEEVETRGAREKQRISYTRGPTTLRVDATRTTRARA